VLSSNDGCIISRSNEAKAIGIRMGEAYFKVRPLLERKGVAVFSGNHKLYRKVSAEVMAVLSSFTDSIEVYSIDEAFLNLSMSSAGDPVAYASKIRREVGSAVGIPVSIGIGGSKTLAKLAAERAKQAPEGVFRITEESLNSVLGSTPVGDIWGIGGRSADSLGRYGVRTALDLVGKDPAWVKKKLTSRGIITQMELQGFSIDRVDSSSRQPRSIQVSRSFGEPLTTLEELEKPIMEHAVSAGARLRRANLSAGAMSVYVRSGPKSGNPSYFSQNMVFGEPISSDHELIREALRALREIYVGGHRYTKAGIGLSALADSRFRQRMLFDEPCEAQRAKYERFARAADFINEKLGKAAIYPAALAVKDKRWRPRCENISSQAPGDKSVFS
jgi:DNA polymerase V